MLDVTFLWIIVGLPIENLLVVGFPIDYWIGLYVFPEWCVDAIGVWVERYKLDVG